MLRIQLKKQTSDVGAAIKSLPVETVTVACPDHLVLADLPVAKGIGAATAATVVKNAGRRSRRQLGERVHFCVRCDFPIAIYGRLSPCEHAFCLDCARSDSICYLCDERIQKIQTIKIMEGIFICAAPHCLKSFLKRTDFESHIHKSHTDLLQPTAENDIDNESEVQSAKQPAPTESTARAPPRTGSNSQLLDTEEKARSSRQQPREQQHQPLQRPMMPKPPPFYGQGPNYLSADPQSDSSRPPGFDRPNFLVPMMPPPQFGLSPFQPPDGGQPFYGGPFEMGQMAGRPDSGAEAGAEQGSLLGFPPGGMSFMGNYPPPPWNMGPTPAGSQGMSEGFLNPSESQGNVNVGFFQGDYGRHIPGVPPPVPSPQSAGIKGMEGGGGMDYGRDGKGILSAAPQQQAYLHPPPPPPLPHPSQNKRGKYYSGDGGHDGQGFGWQSENRDGFGSGQE
ncbi:unnamed protein product [Linum trigynum]|uniref:RING-type E3 ubiquitin transferase n=2 Tax=Linum trigynum TaxID=586398 RepID=A0AAV2DYX8_9ROSI